MSNANSPWPETVPVPPEPLKVALVGAGNRSQVTYAPVFQSLAPWLRIVAVCDPVADHRKGLADKLGALPYADLRELVKDAPMEAAIVVTPVPSHHAISVYLSSHGIHNIVETSMCSTLGQGRNMIDSATSNGVVFRIAENFFRFAIDRFAQTVRDNGHIGPIGRIVSYADHTGFHNNSRWQVFAQSAPLWVQSVEHTVETKHFHSLPHRFHDSETFRGRFIEFENGLFVSDQAANIKGFLGRHQRPGYTEWQGTRGTLVHRAGISTRSEARYYQDGRVTTRQHEWQMASVMETELRYSSDHGVVRSQDRGDSGEGTADEISPVTFVLDDERRWLEMYCETSAGPIRYINPFREEKVSNTVRPDYGVAIMDHLTDFVLAVRGMRESEFTPENALTSLIIEAAAGESARNEGKRVSLPLKNTDEIDAAAEDRHKKRYGFGTLDVEGMLSIGYPRP